MSDRVLLLIGGVSFAATASVFAMLWWLSV